LRQSLPLLICEETSSLRRIFDGLEREFGWTHGKMNVIERKNRLLPYLARRGTLIVLDDVAATPPRVERFIGHLIERVPVWIVCRSAEPANIGAVWQHLYRFAKLELGPLSLRDTELIEAAVLAGRVQKNAVAHSAELYRMAAGNPRIIEALFIELAQREYNMNSFGLELLDLDRRIGDINVAVTAALGEGTKQARS
jgi:hypothetical protein